MACDLNDPCSKEIALKLALFGVMIDIAALAFSISAVAVPSWISQVPSNGYGFIVYNSSIYWDSQLSTGSDVVSLMPNTNYLPQDIYGTSYANWQFSRDRLYWDDLNSPKYNICDPNSQIYQQWSSVYALCDGIKYVIPGEMSVILFLAVLVIISCFFSFFFGLASVLSSSGHRFSRTSAFFAVCATAISFGTLTYITSTTYIRQHVNRPFSTSPVLVISPDATQEQILPIVTSMDYGYGVYFLCFVFILELCSSLIAWSTAAAIKRKRRLLAKNLDQGNDDIKKDGEGDTNANAEEVYEEEEEDKDDYDPYFQTAPDVILNEVIEEGEAKYDEDEDDIDDNDDGNRPRYENGVTNPLNKHIHHPAIPMASDIRDTVLQNPDKLTKHTYSLNEYPSLPRPSIKDLEII